MTGVQTCALPICVIGRVVAIKDDTFVLETGADRVKIRFTKNAISSVEKLNMDNAPKK